MSTQTKEGDLSIVETCALLRVTAPTVYKMLNRGDLVGYKAGRSRRITRDSIERLRSGKVVSHA